MFYVLRFEFWLLRPIGPLGSKNYKNLIKTTIPLNDGSIITAEMPFTLNTPQISDKPIQAAMPSKGWV